MPRNEPATFLRFGLGMGLYVVVVVLQSTWLREAELPLWILVPLALAPLVPVVWGMLGWLDAVRRRDELDRRILSEAGLFALGTTIVASLGWGFLEAYAGFPRPSAFLLVPFVAVNYLGGIVRAKGRYR